MFIDIEETLERELREVADGLHVPAMPRVPEEPPRPARGRAALLAAAAVVLIAAGAVGVATQPDARDTQPAQPSPSPSLEPSPSPSPAETSAPIPRSAPKVPYVLGDRLYVDGVRVPGSWWSVEGAGDAWIAVGDMPPTWWWGRGPEPRELPNGEDVTPKISPNGRYVAVVRPEGDEGMLTVIDTRSGDSVGGTPLSIGPQKWDYPALVNAVLDDGRVIVGREGSHLLWVPGEVRAVDMSGTAPGKVVLGATSAGVVVTDGDGGQPYLAEISDTGRLTRVGELPQHDDLGVSPDGRWLAWTPIGTTGGEVTSVPSLEVSAVDGAQRGTLTAPDGWPFKVRTYAWEDDGHLVSTVTDDRGRDRMARCSPLSGECVLIPNG